jgi:hypothetical protein
MRPEPSVPPLLEFDDSSPAFIEPSEQVPAVDVPEKCVVTFFGDAGQRLREDGRAKLLTDNAWEAGPRPLLEIEHDEQRLALMYCGVGAPLAGALLKEAIAMGCRAFVVCGRAGVPRSDLVLGHLIVVDSALRDEGTSHHYLPAGRHVDADPAAVEVLTRLLDERSVAYQTGRVWTTDAPLPGDAHQDRVAPRRGLHRGGDGGRRVGRGRQLPWPATGSVALRRRRPARRRLGQPLPADPGRRPRQPPEPRRIRSSPTFGC